MEYQECIFSPALSLGSGKSTLAQNIIFQYPTFKRLSIDNTVLKLHGHYAEDFPISQYAEFQEEAEVILLADLKRILRLGREDIVLDLSFYSKQTRNEYRDLIKDEGKGKYNILLVVFRGEEESLWKRIEGRRVENTKSREQGRPTEGMSVDRATLRMYFDGFEWPDGEGEIVISVE